MMVLLLRKWEMQVVRKGVLSWVDRNTSYDPSTVVKFFAKSSPQILCSPHLLISNSCFLFSLFLLINKCFNKTSEFSSVIKKITRPVLSSPQDAAAKLESSPPYSGTSY